MRKLIFGFLFLFFLNLTARAETELAAPIAPLGSEVKETAAIPVAAAAAPLAESEIKVQLDSPKKAATEENMGFKLIMGLAIIAIMGGAAYILIGKYRRTQIGKSSAPEIKVLRQHYLGPKKSLAIIRVAGESILIGMTDQNISMIKSLSLLDEEVPEETPTRFASVFQNTQINEPTTDRSESQEGEEFSISGIRDFVSTRLKNMRSLE